MKLRTKIQLSTSLFMLILVLILNISVYYFFYKMSTNTELEELDLTTKDMISALNENPEVDPGGLMRAYLPANGMIRVVMENDVPLIELTRSKDYLTMPWKFSNIEARKLVNQESGPDIAVIEKPIIWPTGSHKGEIVTIQVSNYLVSLHETMITLMYVLIILSLIVLVPVVVAGSVLSRFLLRPIQNLIRTMQGNMKHGKWQKIAVIDRSRDEIYEMEMTFNEMMEQLKVSYEKQEMFVSDASHELKTPIQIIKSYAQLLERRATVNPELLKESINAIDSEADRMKKLVEQMLSLAKNKQLNKKERVHLMEVVDETTTTFRTAYHRDIRVTAHTSELIVSGDRDQLEQIIYILLENAIKYSKESIDIDLEREGGFVYVKVKDYGQGIPKDEQPRVFDRFYRVDKARSRDTGGTGLGLAIAKNIAKAHDAELSVESELGIGSTFTLKLPVIG